MQPPGGVYLGLQQVEEEGQFLGPQHVMLEGIGLQIHRQNLTSVWRDQCAGSHQQLQRKTKIVCLVAGGIIGIPVYAYRKHVPHSRLTVMYKKVIIKTQT